VSENRASRSTNEPQEGRNGRSKETERDGDDEETGVELRRGDTGGSEFEISSLKSSDTPHATNDQEDDKQQQEVGEQRVDAEHHKHDGIVAREISEIVVDSALDLAKVLGFRESLEVKELSKRLKV